MEVNMKKTNQPLPEVPQDVATPLILKKLFDIEAMVKGKIADIPVNYAVQGFWLYLQKKKKPRGYRYLLEQFQGCFKGRNIATITAHEVEEFMEERWSKANTLRTRHAQLNGLFNNAIKTHDLPPIIVPRLKLELS
jgi:hypothetical protein